MCCVKLINEFGVKTAQGLHNNHLPASAFPTTDRMKRVLGKYLKKYGKFSPDNLLTANLKIREKQEVIDAVVDNLSHYLDQMRVHCYDGKISAGYAYLAQFDKIYKATGAQVCLCFEHTRDLEYLLCGAAVHVERQRPASDSAEKIEYAVYDEHLDLKAHVPEKVTIGDFEFSFVGPKRGGGNKKGQDIFPEILPDHGSYSQLTSSLVYDRIVIACLSGVTFTDELTIPLEDPWNPRIKFWTDDNLIGLATYPFDPSPERVQKVCEKVSEVMRCFEQPDIQEAFINAAILYWNIASHKEIAENLLSSDSPANLNSIFAAEPHKYNFNVRQNTRLLNEYVNKIQENLPLEFKSFYDFISEQ